MLYNEFEKVQNQAENFSSEGIVPPPLLGIVTKRVLRFASFSLLYLGQILIHIKFNKKTYLACFTKHITSPTSCSNTSSMSKGSVYSDWLKISSSSGVFIGRSRVPFITVPIFVNLSQFFGIKPGHKKIVFFSDKKKLTHYFSRSKKEN